MKEEQQKASIALEEIIGTIRSHARLGQAIRGHENTGGNLYIFLEERTLRCPELADWLKRRDKWLSVDIQNEIIEIMAHMVQRKLIDKIN
ncbi:Zinc finger protein 408 [Frankliniella fusca]|uniref:Zinc finger protein 408 n=1 Tax=Frankliniella fusca TaxID=407009 RepID=A0AAE1HBV2_9NEOP|nr:Zinc finger protein 408 [Frankliniella fusca]